MMIPRLLSQLQIYLWRKMLSQAFEMRALVVLIDGVDEAAGLRDEIEEFIHQELVPSGNRVLVTSRPEGVTLPLYRARFVIVSPQLGRTLDAVLLPRC